MGGSSDGTTTGGGGVVVPHKCQKKKVEQKIRQFRRALNRLDLLFVSESKKITFSRWVGLLQRGCSPFEAILGRFGSFWVVGLLQGGCGSGTTTWGGSPT